MTKKPANVVIIHEKRKENENGLLVDILDNQATIEEDVLEATLQESIKYLNYMDEVAKENERELPLSFYEDALQMEGFLNGVVTGLLRGGMKEEELNRYRELMEDYTEKIEFIKMRLQEQYFIND